MREPRYFRVEGVAQPIALSDCDPLLAILPDVLKDWRIDPLRAGAAQGWSLSIERRGPKWLCAAADRDAAITYSDPVSAACWLSANIMRRQTLDEPGRLCLHAASVEIGGGLVVMPSRFRAGKSVLAATLAAMGRRMFGDDVLPVDPATGEAIAPGVAPRLRLPLPETLAPETAEFISGHPGPRGGRYLYLDLPDTLLAPRGARLPIRGVAMLERREDGPTELTRAPAGAALKQVIWQNFGREGAAADILDRLAEIAASAACVTLRYARAEEGAWALIEAFEAPSLEHIPEEPFLLEAERAARERTAGSPNLPPDARLARVEGCALQTRAGEHFLIGAEGLTIMALNDLGAGLWRLMAEPIRYAEALAIVAAAFPGEDGERLDADLRALVAAFRRNGVVEVSL